MVPLIGKPALPETNREPEKVLQRRALVFKELAWLMFGTGRVALSVRPKHVFQWH